MSQHHFQENIFTCRPAHDYNCQVLKTFDRTIRRSTSKKAFRQLCLDDNNKHYNWVSMANSILDEFSLDITDSEDKLKNKVRSIYNKTLVKSLTNRMKQRKKQKDNLWKIQHRNKI